MLRRKKKKPDREMLVRYDREVFKDFVGKQLSVIVRFDECYDPVRFRPVLFFPTMMRWTSLTGVRSLVRQIMAWWMDEVPRFVAMDVFERCRHPVGERERGLCETALQEYRIRTGGAIEIKTVPCLTERHYEASDVCLTSHLRKKSQGRPRKKPA